jgi:predicted subunit of tRNA(5-methylaminomethyl-2-thiouridylate) methyltransferase
MKIEHKILKLSRKIVKESHFLVLQKNTNGVSTCAVHVQLSRRIRWRASEVAAFGKRSNEELGPRLSLSQVHTSDF